MNDFSVVHGSATLRGTENGSGTGRAVVFVHAGVADRRSWLDVMASLNDDNVRCIAYDQRGYGVTSYAPEPYSATGDLLAVLDDRDVDRAVLVGASRGGQIAMDAALSAPDCVAGLMLIGSAPHDAPRSSEPVPRELAELSSAIDAAEAAG